MVKLEIDKLLEGRFIFLVKEFDWISPLVISITKKNGKLRVCVDFKILNTMTKKDYPIPF